MTGKINFLKEKKRTIPILFYYNRIPYLKTQKEKALFCNLITIERPSHHSYKTATTTLDAINFVRGKCKLLEKKKEIHGNKEYEKSSTKNFTWDLTRYAAFGRDSQTVPSWTDFKKLIYPNKNAKVSKGTYSQSQHLLPK